VTALNACDESAGREGSGDGCVACSDANLVRLSVPDVGIRFSVTPRGQAAGMETSGSVRYRRGIMRAVTPTSIAGQLREVREAAAAFGIDAVADALERTATEALAVAETEADAELARQLLAVARQAQVRRSLRRDASRSAPG
jgi:putative aminopeptidase FrvX